MFLKDDQSYYDFSYDNLNYCDFIFDVGLNVAIMKFNDILSRGCFNFCEESNCHLYYNEYGTKVALIEIPDDARIHIDEYNFHADRVIIKEIINFIDLGDDFWINIVKKNGLMIKYIKDQTEEICKLAVQEDANALPYVKKQTEEICKLAVQRNGEALKYVKEQTEEICILAVKKDANILPYVKEQTEEICKVAVQQDGNVLRYVKIQTDNICKLAVQQNGKAIQYVKEPTVEICKIAFQHYFLTLKCVTDTQIIELWVESASGGIKIKINNNKE